jgi:hypothetical protein
MIIKTTRVTGKSPEVVWRGITNAEMILPRPICFRVGIPLPLKCEIVTFVDGVGKKRKCTSDKGFVFQEITKYKENEELEFKMEYNTLEIPFKVESMRDYFKITRIPDGKTVVTRTTEIFLSDDPLMIKSLAVRFGIKAVHRHVFNNIDAA